MLPGKCGVTDGNLVTDNLQDPLCGGWLVAGYMACLPGKAHIWLDCLVLLPPFSEAMKQQAASHSPEQAVVFTAAFIWPLLRSGTKAGTDTAGITAGNQSEPQNHSWSSVVFPWEKCSKAKVKALQARHATQEGAQSITATSLISWHWGRARSISLSRQPAVWAEHWEYPPNWCSSQKKTRLIHQALMFSLPQWTSQMKPIICAPAWHTSFL